MYRNRKYRSGASSVAKSNTTNVVATIAEEPNSIVAVSKSDAALGSKILTDRQNIINEEEDGPTLPKIQRQNRNRRRAPSPLETIPASQIIPVSCYVSQRSILQRTQSFLSGTTSQRTPLSYFERVLQKCGVILSSSSCESSYTLSCDHLQFVIALRKELIANPKFPENTQQFLSGMQESIKTQQMLIKLLSGCAIRLPNSESTSPSQESLVQDFLMVDFLQGDIVEILLNKIKIIAIDHNVSHLQIELILSQLKFVDHIASGDILFKKICEILELADSDGRQTVIRNLPDIIDIQRHNDIVKKLIELIPSDKDLLTEITIDTFGNMSIDPDYFGEICTKIVNYVKAGASIQLLPSFTKFMLNFRTQNTEALSKVIDDVRSCLKWEHFNAGPDNRVRSLPYTNQKDVFNCISRYLLRSKQLFDTWLKLIQSNCERYRPIDLIILLMMMTIKDERSTYIENIIRRKIKTEVMQLKLLEETVQQFPMLLMDFSCIFFEILDGFLRDKTQLLVDFASNAFKLVFGIDNCDRKMLLVKLVGFVCERRYQAPAFNESGTCLPNDVTTNALTILKEINKKYPTEMQKNNLQILRILDYSNDLSLPQFRIVMDILCSLAFMEPQCELLKDHIDMMVKKQVSSSIRGVKNRGIIGVVRMVDHIVWQDDDTEMETDQSGELDCSYNTIDDLPGVSPKIAAKYIDMLITSTMGCPYHLALAFDELAFVFLTRNRPHTSRANLNKHFLVWICDLMTRYFESFVVEEVSCKIPRLELAFLYALDTLADLESDGSVGKTIIAMDIAGRVEQNSSNSLSSIIILPSLFNLMRVLQSRRYGSLTPIDAVLGAAIILPTIMSPKSDCDVFDEFTEDTGKKILDMHFHTTNYWRECISAFASQNDANMRRKVLIRLTEVIQFEKRISELLKSAPDDYVPPICQFMTTKSNAARNSWKFKKPSAPAKKATSRKKTSPKGPNVTSTPVADTDNIPSSEPAASLARYDEPRKERNADSKKFIDVEHDPYDFYRPLDPDVMQLFDENLILKYPLTQESLGSALGLVEFKFLMEDLTSKVESLFGTRKLQSVQNGVNIFHPADFVSDIVEILPKILSFFEQLSRHAKTIIEGSDDVGIENCTELFTEEMSYIKICFSLCLRLLSGLFMWTGFEEQCHQDLLCGTLRAIVSAHQFQTESPPASEIALVGVKSIMQNVDEVLDLRSAVNMFKLVKSLVKHIADITSYKSYVVRLCKKFLSRSWYDLNGCPERGAQYNVNLDELLKGYFKDAKFSFVKSHVTWIQKELKGLKTKNDSFETFPCFSKSNITVLFRVLTSTVITRLEKKIDKNVLPILQLKVWETSYEIVNSLLEIAKALDLPTIFSLFLRLSQTYLKLFLVHGMPVIEACLRKNVERVSHFLKSLQSTTRFLHNLCCHSKEIKNLAVIGQIPAIRETVEQLIYKVKGALAANKCSSVFWMGNLKNKNLQGDEILSQASSITRGSADEEDDGVPGDDDDDEGASNIPTVGNLSDTERDREPRTRSSTSAATERARRSRTGPNLSRSRCF